MHHHLLTNHHMSLHTPPHTPRVPLLCRTRWRSRIPRAPLAHLPCRYWTQRIPTLSHPVGCPAGPVLRRSLAADYIPAAGGSIQVLGRSPVAELLPLLPGDGVLHQMSRRLRWRIWISISPKVFLVFVDVDSRVAFARNGNTRERA